jgi:phenylalanyl-tRNA synthetase alpha subunit
MSFEKESENRLRRNRVEGQELNVESKEKQDEELEKKLGAKERMEQVTHEVKNTKQQMQNIMMNMQQVVKAVAAIRAQLNLNNEADIPSAKQDQKELELLQKKLQNFKNQLDDLRPVLVEEERVRLAVQYPDLKDHELLDQAEKNVTIMFQKLNIE